MITQIHTFGSSHTIGGGFAETKAKLLYKPFTPNPSMETLSWVGQLKELLPPNIEVKNHAKNGAGNEMVYRKVFDLVSNSNFNKDETLLLIEPTFLGRKELWSNTINDYVVINYSLQDPSHFAVVYKHYSNHPKNKEMEVKKEFYKHFISETVSEEESTCLVQRNLLFLLSFLELHKIKYRLVNEIDYFSPSNPNQAQFFTENMKSKRIKYFFRGKETYDIIGDSIKNHSIREETSGRHMDFHQGLFVNRVIAQTVYNELVNSNFLFGNVLEVNHSQIYFDKIKQRIAEIKNTII